MFSNLNKLLTLKLLINFQLRTNNTIRKTNKYINFKISEGIEEYIEYNEIKKGIISIPPTLLLRKVTVGSIKSGNFGNGLLNISFDKSRL